MMTLHLAKGLEFPFVFIVGMEEGLFPHSRSMDQPEEIEEERRLCYVGATRAREKIYFSLATRRHVYGGEHFNPPSRFLEEMPEELIERMGHQAQVSPHALSHNDFDQRQDYERESGYRNGANVRHPTFGTGVIRRSEGSGENQKVTVYFQSGQIKTLMVKFANLSLEELF